MTAPIPFLDVTRLHESIRPELDAAFDRVVRASSFVGSGPGSAFEAAFARAHGRGGAAGCGSGTDALGLALRAARVGGGDEVIVPSMTFVATLEAVVAAGATPVIADVDAETLLLDETSVDAARTERTRAVIPVHLYGHVVPFSALARWRAGGLVVIEDAAQAHLATWRGSPVGSAGHAACFSFYPGKNLGALGDAGAVISDDDGMLTAIRSLRDHGRRDKYLHEDIGWCSRLDGVQAAFLEVKLRHLPQWNASRVALAERYRGRLGGRVISWEEGAVHHLLVVRVPADRRQDIMRDLAASGIGTGIHYPVALSEQPSCRPWATPCPVAARAAKEVLSLPMDPLMTPDEVDVVCDALEKALVNRG